MGDVFRRTDAKDNPAADYASALNKRPIIDGRLVDVTIPVGEISAVAPHGLGRAFRGAILAGTNKPLYPASAYLPSELPASLDPRKVFVVVTTTVVASSDMRCQMWVF